LAKSVQCNMMKKMANALAFIMNHHQWWRKKFITSTLAVLKGFQKGFQAKCLRNAEKTTNTLAYYNPSRVTKEK
jgi:hypothetical protein